MRRLFVVGHGYTEHSRTQVPPGSVVEFLVAEGMGLPGEALEVILNSDSYQELRNRRLVQTDVYTGGQTAPETQFNFKPDPRLVTGVFDTDAVEGSGADLFRMRTTTNVEGRTRRVAEFVKKHSLLAGTRWASLTELMQRFPSAHMLVVACRPGPPPITARLRRPRGVGIPVDKELQRLIAEISSKHSRTRLQHMGRRHGVFMNEEVLKDRSILDNYPRLAG